MHSMRLEKLAFAKFWFSVVTYLWLLYVDHMTSLGFTFHGLVMRCMFLFRLSPALHNYEPVSVLFSRCQLIPAVGRRAGGGDGDCDIQSTKPKIYFNSIH